MDLRTKIASVSGRRVLALDGSADLGSIPALHGALTRLMAHRQRGPLAIDLDGVQLLDDAALGLILGAATRARDTDVDLVVVASPGPVRDRLAATRLDELVTVVARL